MQPNEGATHMPFASPWRFWLLLMAASLVTGVIVGWLMMIMHGAQHLSYAYEHGAFQKAVDRAPAWRRVAALAVAGVLAAVVVYVLKQDVPGHGGELTETIWFRSGQMSFWKTLGQSVLSVTVVGMGASLGREGAPKQMGAATAAVGARFFRVVPAEGRLLAACCAGAAMGAVYNVPLGGAFFSLEVLLGSLTLPLMLPALTSAFVATWASWMILPDRPTYTVASHGTHTALIIWALVCGPLFGLGSVVFIRLVLWADRLKPKRGVLMIMPFIVFTLLGLAAMRYPQLLGNGKDVTEEIFEGALALPLLAALVVLKPLATAACLASGAPGGLFTPSLTFGAIMGGLAGRLWAFAWPGTSVESCALVGAVTAIAVTMQAPLSAFILFAELTHHVISLMIPMIASVTVAMLTARRLEPRSVYSGKIYAGRSGAHTARLRPMPALAPWFTDKVCIISAAADYTQVLARTLATRDGAGYVYVVNEKGALLGRIGRERALHPGRLPPIVSTAAAYDLTEAVTVLTEDAGPDEVEGRLRGEPGGEWPVVERGTGRLLGVVRADP